MIVDTSALMAIVLSEPGNEQLAAAVFQSQSFIPTVVLFEYARLISGVRFRRNPTAETLPIRLLNAGMTKLPFTEDHLDHARAVIAEHGSGNGRGGTLNFIDLIVYGTAKAMKLPILCTGRDFAATDAMIHEASRVG